MKKKSKNQGRPLGAYSITMKEWQKMHPFDGIEYDTDSYYHKIANRIVRILEDEGFVGAYTKDDIRYAALRLAAYFEDVVSELCIFRSFLKQYRQEYYNDFPWYKVDEEYLNDEVNLVDVQLVLWLSLLARRDSSVPNPENAGILSGSRAVYNLLLEEFDNAPINEELSVDIYGDDSFEDLENLIAILSWLATSCYLSMRMFPARTELKPTLDALHALFLSPRNDIALVSYLEGCYLAFAQLCSPLAISPSSWFYYMHQEKGNYRVPVDLLTMSTTPVYPFVVTDEDEDTLTLCSCRGKEYLVLKESFMQPQLTTLGVGDIVITMLFQYKGYWNVFGMALSMPIRDLDKAFDDLERRAKRLTKETGAKIDLVGELDWGLANNSLYGIEYDPLKCARAITRNNGSRLFYFKNPNEVNKWMGDKIVGRNVKPVNQPGYDSSIALFITDDHRIIFSSLARYIHDPNNPYYDPKTEDEIFSFMLQPEKLSWPLCEYMINHGYADRLGFESLYGKEHGRKLVQGNIRFFMTLMRQEQF